MPTSMAKTLMSRRQTAEVLQECGSLTAALLLCLIARPDSTFFVSRAHHDQAPVRTGDRAAHEQNIILAVHAHDLKVADGVAGIAVAPGHAFAPLGAAATAVAGVRADAAGG